jgi:hypothetical protein
MDMMHGIEGLKDCISWVKILWSDLNRTHVEAKGKLDFRGTIYFYRNRAVRM